MVELHDVVRHPLKAGLYAVRNPVETIDWIIRNFTIGFSTRYQIGTPVWEKRWDVLIILDTCRIDALQEVADEYDFIETVGSIKSVGGNSSEWIASTFCSTYSDEIRDTAYVVRNGWAYRVFEEGHRPGDSYGFATWDVVDTDDLGLIDHVWKLYESTPGSLDTHRYRDPRYVTDRAIQTIRANDFDRTIIHYSRPHAPYVANAMTENRELYEYEQDPFGYLKRTGERELVYGAYLDDLRYVLDEVQLLLENIDAEDVVISADHGEAFGEYNLYAHGAGSLHPHVRNVPWVRTTARNEETYIPELTLEESNRSVEEALEALGYKM